ncbi:MAG: hypothetical protein K2N74_05245, partial [Clostridiales bacterium]|nr:hypothetical protein [Clostridiales bacterium]
MKKKIVLMLTSLTCALCMVLGFAACNDEGDDGDPINKDTDVGELTSQQLTEEQWKAALAGTNFANFKAHLKMTSTQGEETRESTQDVEVDGDKLHLSAASGTETMEGYAAVVDGKYYTFELKEDEKWYRSESSYNIIEQMKEEYLELADMYSDFTYSETEKGYLYSETEGEGDNAYTYTMVVKFLNDKLCAVINNSESGDYTYKSEGTLFDYGKASVTLPEKYEDAEGEPKPMPGPTAEEVAGKSYLFAEVLDAGSSQSEGGAAEFTGGRITFTDDGNYAIKVFPSLTLNVAYSGTYVQDEEELTLAVLKMTLNGEAIPGVSGISFTGEVVEGGIKLTAPYDENDTVTLLLEEVEEFEIDQYTDFDEIVSDQVTKAEWAAIFTAENFANYQVISRYTDVEGLIVEMMQVSGTTTHLLDEQLGNDDTIRHEEAYFST